MNHHDCAAIERAMESVCDRNARLVAERRRMVELWAQMKNPPHPDSAVPFNELDRLLAAVALPEETPQ